MQADRQTDRWIERNARMQARTHAHTTHSTHTQIVTHTHKLHRWFVPSFLQLITAWKYEAKFHTLYTKSPQKRNDQKSNQWAKPQNHETHTIQLKKRRSARHIGFFGVQWDLIQNAGTDTKPKPASHQAVMKPVFIHASANKNSDLHHRLCVSSCMHCDVLICYPCIKYKSNYHQWYGFPNFI